MDTTTKVTLAIGTGFLALIVGMLAVLSTAQGCATGKTQQLITYQNAERGEWITEPIYAECEGN